jgi:polyhydroxyalkanoate synthase subunit PhaC
MIVTPAGALRAVANMRDRVLAGPLADLRRMPRTAIDTGPSDPDARAIGRAHGLARAGSVSTYRYAVHPTAPARGAPVLLVSPLGACGVAFDLRRGHSLVEELVNQGRYVHQVDDEDVVGHGGAITAGPADLQRWVDEILPHVVRTVSAHHDGAPVHLVGWSIGGLVSVLAGAAHPDLPLASTTAVATPFLLDDVPPVAPPRPLAVAAGGPLLATVQTLLGLLPLPVLLRRLGLGSLDELLTAPLTVLAHLDDRDFLAQLEAVDDLRALVGDQARLVGTYFRQMVGSADLAGGRVAVGRRTVRLAALEGPVLLVAGEDDVVVPPRAVRAGARVLTGGDVRLATSPGGHHGVLAGRRARDTTWVRLSAFLDRHDPPATLEPAPRTPSVPREARRPLPRSSGTGTGAALPATDDGRDDQAPAVVAAEVTAPVAAVTAAADLEQDGADPAAPTRSPRKGAPARRSSSRLPAPKRATRTRGGE